MNKYPVARHYRDSKCSRLVRGTTEVQLMLSRDGWDCSAKARRRP